MLFHSLDYFIFLPIVVAAYFATPVRLRWIPLLAASYWFYGSWRVEYLALVIISSSIDYAAGIGMGRETRAGRRRALLVLSLCGNLGFLFAFKYLDFFGDSLDVVLAQLNSTMRVPRLDVLLPVGISFYTFQSMSYAIDVYRRDREPETHYGYFALYVMFFPQLVAGPIERSTTLLPQLRAHHAFDYDRLVSGLGMVLWGLFKKVVVADRAALIVNAVYADPDAFQGTTILVATYAFAFQIYCDFSGYSDIAIGSARIFGIELMANFDRPYWSASIAEFWRRWHISLSTWFRDYLYIALGGSRAGELRRVVNVGVVFLSSGLWHGANWTFVLWGAFHGFLVTASMATSSWWRRYRPPKDDPPRWHAWLRPLRVLLVFHLVCFGWIMFRADDMDHLARLVARLPVSFPTSTWHELTHLSPAPPESQGVELVVLAVSIAALEIGDWLRRSDQWLCVPPAARWVGWAALASWVALTPMQTHSPFIYFQF